MMKLKALLVDKHNMNYILYPSVNFVYPNCFHEKNSLFVADLTKHLSKLNQNPSLSVDRESVLRKLSNVRSLLLEITTVCNSRCRYCVYSGKFHDRRPHGNEKMTLKTAKLAIDFFFDWMVQQDNLRTLPYIPSVSFYGGEPLTNFDFLKECFNYSKRAFEEKIVSLNFPDSRIGFSLTTNGLLLNEEIIQYFVKHDFHITISLDGPKEIHDENRGNGNFDQVFEKVRYLREIYPEFYKRKVSFSIVYSKDTDLEKVRKFFSQDIFEDSLHLNMGSVTRYFSDIQQDINGVNENRVIDSIILKKKKHLQLSQIEEKIVNQYFEFSLARIGTKYIPGGYCTLGSKSLFVRCNGDFFGCEKMSDSFKIGSIYNGFDVDRIMEIEEEWINSTKMCRECIIQNSCHACVGTCGVDSHLKFEEYCNAKKTIFLRRIQDYIEFMELK